MRLKQTINRWESYGLEIMSAFAPWLAPIPSAYFVGVAVYHTLGTHILIGIIAAVAVEAVGIVSITNALRLYEWNQTKRKSDPHAPLWLALATVFVYFAVTILLTVLLESFPQLSHIAPAVFPILAAVGALNIAVRNSQNTRETAREREGEERSMKARETAVKGRETRLKAKADIVKGREAILAPREDAVATREDEVAEREDAQGQRESDVLAREETLALYEAGIMQMNPISRDLLAMMAGNGDTQTAIAERHSVSAGYVSGVKAKMNGAV